MSIVAKRSPILATAILLFFDTKDLNENQIRSPSTAGAPNTYGVGKICDCQPITQKRYKIVAYLLLKINRKSYHIDDDAE